MSVGGFSQDLRQRQSQSLVLAPQLRQSLKILQVAALDLRSVIQEELQSNPTLEELPMEGMSPEKETAEKGEADANGDDAAEGAEGTPDPAVEQKREEMDFSKEFEILGKIDDDWRDYMASTGGAQAFTSEDAERRQHFFDSVATETSLQEHLMRQAEIADLSPNALEAMQHLVGSLDDRGLPDGQRPRCRPPDGPAPRGRPGGRRRPEGVRAGRASARRPWPSACLRSWPRRAGATPWRPGSSGTSSSS